MSKSLNSISNDVKQTIFECVLQAIGEDRQAAEAQMELKTHVSAPYLNWDLIYRNLIQSFGKDNVIKYSVTVRGMWTVMLLYDVQSGFLISLMRDSRFNTIKQAKTRNRPKYVQALLQLNKELQAKNKQQTLPGMEQGDLQDETQILAVLDQLCSNFNCPISFQDVNHVLVCFSGSFRGLSSLNAYVLDRDLDIVEEQNWLDMVAPVISNSIETVSKDNCKQTSLSLTTKARERLKEKGFVGLKEKERENRA